MCFNYISIDIYFYLDFINELHQIKTMNKLQICIYYI